MLSFAAVNDSIRSAGQLAHSPGQRAGHAAVDQGYWAIEAALHRCLEGAARVDRSRARNRNRVLAPGMDHRIAMGCHLLRRESSG
jgi:hypothetical protein